MTRAQYIDKYWKYAVFSQLYSNLYPSVTLAQGILESGNGNSSLTAKYNNHFGIKAHEAVTGWMGKTVNLQTGEVIRGQKVTIKDSFRVYNTAWGSYRDHRKFLEKNSRYATNGVFSATTPQEQCKALKRAGYATGENYANTLIQLIKDNNLERFDGIKRIIEFMLPLAALGSAYLAYKHMDKIVNFTNSTFQKFKTFEKL